jgi:hypothetical protein
VRESRSNAAKAARLKRDETATPPRPIGSINNPNPSGASAWQIARAPDPDQPADRGDAEGTAAEIQAWLIRRKLTAWDISNLEKRPASLPQCSHRPRREVVLHLADIDKNLVLPVSGVDMRWIGIREAFPGKASSTLDLGRLPECSRLHNVPKCE